MSDHFSVDLRSIPVSTGEESKSVGWKFGVQVKFADLPKEVQDHILGLNQGRPNLLHRILHSIRKLFVSC